MDASLDRGAKGCVPTPSTGRYSKIAHDVSTSILRRHCESGSISGKSSTCPGAADACWLSDRHAALAVWEDLAASCRIGTGAGLPTKIFLCFQSTVDAAHAVSRTTRLCVLARMLASLAARRCARVSDCHSFRGDIERRLGRKHGLAPLDLPVATNRAVGDARRSRVRFGIPERHARSFGRTPPRIAVSG